MCSKQHPSSSSSSSSSSSFDRKAYFYMMLLALQFGVQPILTRRYTPKGIIKSTVIMVQEALKFGMAGIMLHASSSSGGARKSIPKDWSLASWLTVAFVPAGLYCVQNMSALVAYQNLDALTYNVLNQTKTLSAALCCYLVMGKTQSRTQIVSLLLLLVSALVMEGIVPLERIIPTVLIPQVRSSSRHSDGYDERNNVNEKEVNVEQWESRHWKYGVLPVLAASFISGLAGALSQKNLQSASTGSSGARNAYFFTMELCLGSILLLSASLLVSADGQRILEHGFWHLWTPQTFLPILTNSAGGIVVGLVTKYAGSVRKGFALIFGILISGVIQAMNENKSISNEHIAGGIIAAFSLYVHSANPPCSLVRLSDTITTTPPSSSSSKKKKVSPEKSETLRTRSLTPEKREIRRARRKI